MTTSAREDTNSSAPQNAGVGFWATLEAFASERNIMSGMFTGIIVTGAAFIGTIFLPWEQAYISCVIGIVSMCFAAWVAYWSVRVQDVQYRKAILQPVLDLERAWHNGSYSAFLEMNATHIQEASDVFEALESQEIKFSKREKALIKTITDTLRAYKEGKKQPLASNFKSELKSFTSIL